ncbi:MAG: ATP-binding cassette domain-containing protein [Clostridiales bacterium]|nr:ATP-binding cassette domain-containing protein [Clostridiales bacterium]
MSANKHYAFVGVHGAGKTTIAKLLSGLYDNYTL